MFSRCQTVLGTAEPQSPWEAKVGLGQSGGGRPGPLGDQVRPADTSSGYWSGAGCHSLLQGIFPKQGLNLGLLHCRKILYPLSHQGSPFTYSHVQLSLGPELPQLRTTGRPAMIFELLKSSIVGTFKVGMMLTLIFLEHKSEKNRNFWRLCV